jgi:colicin import membrane protein
MSTKMQAKRAQRSGEKSSEKRSFTYSLVAHALVLVALFMTSSTVQPIQQRPSSPQVVQQSTTVNPAALQHEIAAVKAERVARINQEKRRVEALQSRQARIQRSLKQKQQALSKQQSRLAKLKSVQRKEQQQLANLQKKKAAAAKVFSNQQKALSATEQKLKNLRKEQQAVKNAVEKQKLAQKAKALAEKLRKQQLAAERAQLQRQRMNDGIIDRYRARILAAIQSQWIVPKETKPGMQCKFLVQLSAAGVVQQVKLLKSSGSPVLDRSARVALLKASPLPVPKDSALNAAFRSIRLAVKPGMY